jgi:hypothetical protein
LTIFQVNFKIILRKFQKFAILKKNLKEHRKRHLLPKFKPSSIFTKISKVILFLFLTPEFAQGISKFKNSEYEVHQFSPTDEG